MSGLIGSNSLSIDMQNLQSDAGNYRLVSFPERVRVTSVGFTVNSECMGAYEDERVWKIYCLVGHPDPQVGNPWQEYTHPIFGLSEKPTVSRDRKFTSSYMTNAVQVTPKPNGGIETLDLDYGVIAPGGYLSFWVQNESGDVSLITWEDTAANVTITYEPTNHPSWFELVQEYPVLD